MRDFYENSLVLSSGMLKVSELHTIWYEECGNPNGIPVVFLHGGPGGGILDWHKGFFNPEKYRVILFDQRGCGKSKPFSELRENTTWHLVDDIEKLRCHLSGEGRNKEKGEYSAGKNIEKWAVFGGSWGSTLALAYAVRYPERVSALFLRGIFLLRKQEIEWFYQFGASEIFPDAFENYIAPIPLSQRHDLLGAFSKQLHSEIREVRATAARAWSIWEGTTSKLLLDPSMQDHFGNEEFADAFARIECHYFTNHGFFSSDNFLIESIDVIRKIPATIVQGRYDVICPMRSAWDLHKAWPEAKFQVIADAGHSASEAGIRSALIEATDAFSNEFKSI